MTTEIDEKTSRLIAVLHEEDLGGVLLNGQHNFAWLTGGASNGIDLSRDNGIATLLVTADGKRYVLANNIEMPRLLAEQISQDQFEPLDFTWQNEKADPDLVFETAKSIVNGPIGSDLPITSKTRVIEGTVAKCRHRLTRNEADRIRRLGNDAGTALDSLVTKIAPGETETQIAEKLRAELAVDGIMSVVTLVAADGRTEQFRHPVPTERIWQKTLLLVTCARRAGLIVSLSRIVHIGPVPDSLQRRTEAAAFVNASLWNATRPGTNGADLYQVAADAYREKGFAGEVDKHHQGGAAGYRTREWVAHHASREIVQANQAFTWNPSITGTKIEETVIVNETGVEVLTASPGFPSISTEIDGFTYYSPGILSL